MPRWYDHIFRELNFTSPKGFISIGPLDQKIRLNN